MLSVEIFELLPFTPSEKKSFDDSMIQNQSLPYKKQSTNHHMLNSLKINYQQVCTF